MGCSVTCGCGRKFRDRKLAVSQGPPATIMAKFDKLEELQAEVEAHETHRVKVLMLAFATGSLSLVMFFAVLRVFRRRREGTQRQSLVTSVLPDAERSEIS